jgi:hypothetical protein
VTVEGTIPTQYVELEGPGGDLMLRTGWRGRLGAGNDHGARLAGHRLTHLSMEQPRATPNARWAK